MESTPDPKYTEIGLAVTKFITTTTALNEQHLIATNLSDQLGGPEDQIQAYNQFYRERQREVFSNHLYSLGQFRSTLEEIMQANLYVRDPATNRSARVVRFSFAEHAGRYVAQVEAPHTDEAMPWSIEPGHIISVIPKTTRGRRI